MTIDLCAKELLPALIGAVVCFGLSELLSLIPEDVVKANGLLDIMRRFVNG